MGIHNSEFVGFEPTDFVSGLGINANPKFKMEAFCEGMFLFFILFYPKFTLKNLNLTIYQTNFTLKHVNDKGKAYRQ